jgi:hypothetical protein
MEQSRQRLVEEKPPLIIIIYPSAPGSDLSTVPNVAYTYFLSFKRSELAAFLEILVLGALADHK